MLNECYIGDVRDGLRATVAELAYCAGVIDSDGTIGVKRSTYAMRVMKDSTQPTYSERICVRQVEPEAVRLLHSIFAGCLRGAKAYANRGKPLYEWSVTDRKAAACLVALLPYLRIKHAQAQNCIALRVVKEQSKVARVSLGRGHKGAGFRPVSISDAMEQHFLAAKELNRVGV